ncbi:MAG: hypothetical protein ABSG54_03340 [Terriglobia bacterium]|jgi:hypothetical protein
MAITKAKLLAAYRRLGRSEEETLQKWENLKQGRRESREERRKDREERLADLAASGELADATHAETMVRFLSDRLCTRMPRLRFNGRGGGYYADGSICLSKVSRKSTVAHEFAHHLDASLNGHSREGHSRSFYSNLKRVVEALGMDYPWDREYLQVQRWARQDGLLKDREAA